MFHTMEMEMETYRECMRNHAATLGTYATDGCGEYTSDPSSPGGFHCAACGCHRNFHRKVLQAAGGGDSAAACDGLALTHSPSASAEGGRLRRTRTRFTAEQKEKMLWFAEKIRWRIPREGGGGGNDEVGRFCREIGVARQVFKVWMHNHKTAGGGGGTAGGGGVRSSSTPPSSSTSTATTTTTGTAATGTTTGTASEANVSSLTQ